MTLDEHRVFFSKFAEHLHLKIIEDIHNRNSVDYSCHVKFINALDNTSVYIADYKNFETEFEFISNISFSVLGDIICDAYQLVLNFFVQGCEIRIKQKTEVAPNITHYTWERIKIPKMSSEEELMLWFAANWGI